ncbi:MAG TPA: SPOR domain-containing protein [Stellaceae bacterium]|nr:SPOR domain-containing protein [Stellaceae bacterium]
MTFGADPEDRIPGAPVRSSSKWPRHFGAAVRVGVVLVVIGAAAASGWPYIKEHFLTSSAPTGPLPVIGPGDEPIKEAPKQPGGMQVPDQDKIILNGTAAQPKVEQILPPPPAPLPAPAPSAVAQTPPPVPPMPSVASSPTPSPPAVASAPPPAAPATSSPPAEAPQPPLTTVTPPPPPPPPRPASVATTNPPASSVPATTSGERAPAELASHGWFVQLGAVRSTAAAQAEWTRLKRAQPDLLASLSANAVRVDRAGAVLYRIEAGPLADADTASHLCRSLQQRHVACIVLRP